MTATAERVRKLRAKADSTTFPAEAAALRAKAQELMGRHGLTESQVRFTPQAPRVFIQRPGFTVILLPNADPSLATLIDPDAWAAHGFHDIKVTIHGGPGEVKSDRRRPLRP